MTRCLALLAFLACPAAGRAAYLTDLFPDDALLVVGIDVKSVMDSPLGKKVVGADKPFDATRKLLKVLFGDAKALFPEVGVLSLEGDAAKPVAAGVNKIERVTVVISEKSDDAIFLEGELDEAEFTAVAKAVAKARDRFFVARVRGEREALAVPRNSMYGMRLSKSLYLVASGTETLDDVLSKHDGKKKAKVQKPLLDTLGKVKPAETPIWLAAGEWKDSFFKTDISISSAIATVALADNAEIRIRVTGLSDESSKFWEGIPQMVELVAALLDNHAFWKAAGMTAKRDDKTVTAAVSIPGKLLADEYEKQK